MITNPMQKMKRNSMLVGVLAGLIVGTIICVFIYIFFLKGTISTKSGQSVSVCVLNKTVSSGGEITISDVIRKNVDISDVPSDAVSISETVTSKINLSAGTILTSGMINENDTEIKDDLREKEYNMITLPIELKKGDYVDIRLELPNAGDFIVISKKQIVKCDSTTIWLNMYEEEIEIINNAIIEYYTVPASKLYAVKYTDPGIQKAATPNYVPGDIVYTIIRNNSNIKSFLNSERYSDVYKQLRNQVINPVVQAYYTDTDGDGRTDALDNIETNKKDEIEKQKEAREQYFSTLSAAQ